MERLCNHLPPATPLDYSAISPGYDPHLSDHTSGMDWTPRDSVTYIDDVMRMESGENIMIRIKTWLNLENRLWAAVKSGWFVGGVSFFLNFGYYWKNYRNLLRIL